MKKPEGKAMLSLQADSVVAEDDSAVEALDLVVPWRLRPAACRKFPKVSARTHRQSSRLEDWQHLVHQPKRQTISKSIPKVKHLNIFEFQCI